MRLDVFALEPLAYYVLAGRPAARDRTGLRERLRRDDGLDLAADLPQVPSAVRAVVLQATRPVVTERPASAFLPGAARGRGAPAWGRSLPPVPFPRDMLAERERG